MQRGISTCGYLSQSELDACPGRPTPERLKRGRVAVIECVQEIPCNPCEAACPRQAIHVGQPITNLPVLDGEACVGCGKCVARCPGLAIFILDMHGPGDEGTISFPHEFLPLPAVGDVVQAVDRSGAHIVDGRVVRVQNANAGDGTPVVTISVPKEYVDLVRGMVRLREEHDAG